MTTTTTPSATVQTEEAVTPLNLSLDVEAIKGQLVPVSAQENESKLNTKVDALLANLLSVQANDVGAQERWKTTIEQAGADIAKRSSERASMLRKPMKDFMKGSEDDSSIATALVELSMQVQELNPNEVDFSASGLGKLLSRVPGVGSKIQRYFMKYETADVIIDGIMKSLVAGAETLKRDNITLAADQKNLRADSLKLNQVVALLILLDKKLSEKIENEVPANDPRFNFLQDEILFPLRQTVQDRQELLLACQQGVTAYEILIRNNKELIRGVGRAKQVTLRALEIAVTIAVGLCNQQLVLKSLEKVNKVTSDLLAGTSARLKTQGVEIHRQASSANLDPEKLKLAFADLHQAVQDISTYRQEALPKMAAQIIEFDQMAQKGEEIILKIEAGNRASAAMKMDDSFFAELAA